MRRIKPIHVVIMIVFIISAIFYINYDFKRMDKISKQINMEYPLFKINEAIDGIVTFIYLPKGFRNDPYSAGIILNDSLKRGFLSYSRSQNYVVDDVLTIGSRLVKAAGSDTICIQNVHEGDTISYYFKLENLDD